MKVKELIAKLSLLAEQEADVVLLGDEEGYDEVGNITKEEDDGGNVFYSLEPEYE